MNVKTRDGTRIGSNAPALDAALVDNQLREALAARAERLGIDPASITTPAPGAVIARSAGGALLRLDFRTYRPDELIR